MNWLFYPCSTVLRSLLLPNESQSDTSPKWIGPLATSFYRFGGAPSHRTPAALGGARSPRRRRQYAAVAPTLGGGARSRRPHARTLSCVRAFSLLWFSSPPNQQEINGSKPHVLSPSKSKQTFVWHEQIQENSILLIFFQTSAAWPAIPPRQVPNPPHWLHLPPNLSKSPLFSSLLPRHQQSQATLTNAAA